LQSFGDREQSAPDLKWFLQQLSDGLPRISDLMILPFSSGSIIDRNVSLTRYFHTALAKRTGQWHSSLSKFAGVANEISSNIGYHRNMITRKANKLIRRFPRTT
jgi:hypothetical protein